VLRPDYNLGLDSLRDTRKNTPRDSFIMRKTHFSVFPCRPGWAPDPLEEEEEEEEEEDLFVFNDTIEGPRAPAVKPGRVTQA
jgi:hypothetical protein